MIFFYKAALFLCVNAFALIPTIGHTNFKLFPIDHCNIYGDILQIFIFSLLGGKVLFAIHFLNSRQSSVQAP